MGVEPRLEACEIRRQGVAQGERLGPRTPFESPVFLNRHRGRHAYLQLLAFLLVWGVVPRCRFLPKKTLLRISILQRDVSRYFPDSDKVNGLAPVPGDEIDFNPLARL